MNEENSQNQYGQQNNPPAGQQPPASPPPPPPGGYCQPQYHPQTPQQRQNSKLAWAVPLSFAAGCLIWPILGLLGFLVFVVGIAGIVGSGPTLGSESGPHIALIRIGGIIAAGRSGSSLFGDTVSGSEDIVEQLEKARRNKDVKAIVLRINSPGGSASGSEEVFNEIERVRKSGKPVYVSMADVAASGGYYIAAPCDRIFADHSTITGSIGVIFDTADMSELYKKIGLKPQTIKSGKFKDIGSSARPLTTEERALVQGMVDNIFNTFVNAVAQGRKMPVAEVKKLADGRVFTGDQALKVKLIDEIGGLRETTLAAAKAGGIKGEPKVVEYGKRGLFGSVFGSDSESAAAEAERALGKKLIEQMRSGDETFILR